MSTNLILKEQSIKIARDFLIRSGEMDDEAGTILFLAQSIELMMQAGVTSRLILSNLAISAYQRFRKSRTIEHELSERAS